MKWGDEMKYDLWDVVAQFRLERFDSEEDAVQYVRDLADEEGEAYVRQLKLLRPGGGNVGLSGAALLAMAAK